MNATERAELRAVYEQWTLEKLARAFANQRADYQPEALEVMREVLTARGATDSYLQHVREATPRPGPDDLIERAFREKKGDIFGRRLVAFCIDTLLSSGMLLAADLLLGSALYQRTLGLWLLLFSAYYIVAEGRFGATPGKKLMSLRVVNEQRVPCGYVRAGVRFFFRIFECYALPLLGLIAYFNSNRGRRIGDAVAGTLVVRVEDLVGQR